MSVIWNAFSREGGLSAVAAMLWPLGFGAASLGLACLPLLFGLAPDLAIAQAQTAVCSNTPAAEERIECTEDATSTSNIEIEAVDIDIDTTVDSEPGIHAKHEGTGNVEVDVRSDNSSTIDSAGSDSHGIHGEHAGTGDIIMKVQGTEITTTGDSSHGVYAEHTGDGNIDIDVTDGSDIDIQGEGDEFAIRAALVGDGDIDVLVDDTTTNSTIDIRHRGVGTSTVKVTNGTIDSDHKNGIFNQHSHTNLDSTKNGRTDTNTYVVDTNITLSGIGGVAVLGEVSSKSTLGDVLVDVDGAVIKTTGVSAIGIKGRNLADVGDVDVNVRDSTVESVSFGIEAMRSSGGRGAVRLDVRDTEVTTTKNYGFGIKVNNGSEDATADDVHTVFIEDSTITTKGFEAHGIRSERQSVGDVVIEIRNVDIVTESTAHSSYGDTYAVGIFAWHNDTSLASNPLAEGGDLKLDVQGGSITTYGKNSYGILGFLEEGNGGEISITTGGGNSITTTGDGGHGIVAYHYGTAQPTSSIAINAGGSIDVSGAGAQGIRVGRVIADGAPDRVAAIGADGYRRQTVTVNGPIKSAAEGVYLANGGRVVIGPQGSIRSASGIAILATGTVPGVMEDDTDPNNVIPAVPAIPPKLRVDLNLGGRRVAQAIGDDWILNDGGETTIAMNGVVLHDGTTGVTGETARNGVWNVRMQAGGVRVTDRTNADPAMWTESDRTESVIADRDFGAGDFTEAEASPPSEPDPPAVDAAQLRDLVEGAVANALANIVSASLAEQTASASPFVEEYAPRAAVYEALPGALLGLNDAGQETGAPPPQGSFSFAHTLEGRGGFSPAGSTVGQSHDFGYDGVQFGWNMELSETLGASFAFHRVRSTVGVDAGTGGGRIGVEASGFVLDGAWKDPDGFYAKAGLSMTHYDIDAGSQDPAVGMLTQGIEARGSLVRLETGREIALNGGLDVAPRLWLKRSALSVDDFADSVGSRVSVFDTARIAGGVGMTAGTERRAGGGMLTLQGSFDLARVLDGTVAVTEVSGSRLASQAEETELRLALAGVYRQGGFSLAAETSMNGSHLDAIGARLSVQF